MTVMPLNATARRNPRSMFWLLCLRSLQVKRPQAMLGIGSLIVGAAVCSLLLNLYGGVERKMSDSFRAFGANVILAPRETAHPSSALLGVMEAPKANRFDTLHHGFPGLATVPMLYVVMHLNSAVADPQFSGGGNVLAVGTDLGSLIEMNPNWRVEGARAKFSSEDCLAGARLAKQMNLHPGDRLELGMLHPAPASDHAAAKTFRVAAIVSTGASADDQVFVPLGAIQALADLPGKVSNVELRVPGGTHEIQAGVNRLVKSFPEMSVRPVRQIVYSEGKVLGTIRRLMLALTSLILVIIALCVTAVMTAMVIERRKDVAVMKALGASDRLVMEIFLSEGAVLGLLGGLTGFFIGAILARGVALRLFGVSLAPDWRVFPVVCVSTMMLAIIATLFPVRMVRSIQPASALKGA